ncbi:MAG: oligosaccharide flippase family protein [Actinobacteria bacterium]|nr:oligosaccharide flippase family protein [Actinomycetota bacterium]
MIAAIRRLSGRVLGTEARGFAKDSGALAISTAIVQVGHLLTIVLIARGLGLRELGRFSLVISFVAVVGQFFDVRIDKAVITFGAMRASSNMNRVAEIVKLGFVVDTVTGVAAFAVVAGAASLLGHALVGPGGAGLLILYAITLALSFGDDTGKGVLQLFSRYGVLTAFAVCQELLRLTLVAAAVLVVGSLRAVILALVVVDLAAAVAYPLLSAAAFRRAAGGTRLSLLRRPAAPKDRTPMLKMIFHTNLVSYAKVIQARAPILVLGAFATPLDVGVYRIGMSAASVLGAISDPALKAVHPRIARLWAAGRRVEVSTLLKQASRVSVPLMAVAGAGLLLARRPLLDFAGAGGNVDRAALVLAIGLAGFAASGAAFWNTQVLLATGRSGRVAFVTLATSVGVHLPLLLLLIPAWGVTGAAVATAAAMTISTGWTTIEALRVLRDPTSAPTDRRIVPGIDGG